MKKYTQDWFSHYIPVHKAFLEHLKDKENVNFLEIGSFEGLSTNWFLENILTSDSSKIYCIDAFEGSEEHKNLDLTNLHNIFLNNVSEFKDKVKVFKGKSSEKLYDSEIRSKKFDFIFIDGCHESKEVLEDAVLCWDLLKVGGIMNFDDVMGGDIPYIPTKTPKIAVESFVNSYKEYIEVLYVNYQVVIKKVK